MEDSTLCALKLEDARQSPKFSAPFKEFVEISPLSARRSHAVEERDVIKVSQDGARGGGVWRVVCSSEIRDGIWGKCAHAVFSFCGCLFVQHTSTVKIFC
ncbi:hypothetical protein CEXT_756021 [Caerostris extrusa]|uniref:Uncharacterized protein n=1 Tax=Caerostris extrusa TaxID=172846 RepID=A0AAV4R6D9_CAEEX|nr:hypothetical protein CEXT_756021 [Caerostris extrusa]